MNLQQTKSALHNAVIGGETAEINLALQEPHDIEERSRSMTPLQFAGHVSEYNMLPILLDAGANINAPASALGCAIQTTISSNQYDGMPDAMRKNHSHTASIQAKKAAQLGAVQLLLSRGADPNIEGGEYGSSLATASAYGRVEIVKLLLAHGADPSSKGGRMGSALQAACARGGLPVEWAISFAGQDDYTAIQELLIDAGADVNAVGGLHGTTLQAAAAVGDEKAVTLLLSRGADPNVHAGQYGCPLRAATNNDHNTIANELITYGAKLQPDNNVRLHVDDNWSIWKSEPVTSLWMKFGVPLPSITNDQERGPS